MATDFLGVDFTAKVFPFEQRNSFNATRYGQVPWGQAIVNESFDTPAIGSGNDGLLNVDIELPSDYVAMLRNLDVQMIDTASMQWNEGVMGFAYQQPGGPYKTTVSSYPEDEYSWYTMRGHEVTVKDRFSTNRFYRLFQLVGGDADHPVLSQGWDPTQLPLWIPPTAEANFQDRSVVMFFRNGSASQPAARMTIRMSFDLFTLDQAYSAAVMSSPRVFP